MKEITIKELKENPVKLISEDWALLTVKDAEKGSCNPMTVSWGGVGELWGADMATIYVRESRYTKTLLDTLTNEFKTNYTAWVEAEAAEAKNKK